MTRSRGGGAGLQNRKIAGLTNEGGQDRVEVRRPHCHHKDVGSNPAATRNEKWTLG